MNRGRPAALSARSRHALRPWVGALLVLLGARSAAAGPVVVLRSGTLGPYLAASEGCRHAVPDPVVELNLTDLSPHDLERRIARERPDAVVAIGLKAALFARARLSRVPIVYCAVQDPEEHDLVGAWITGVRVDIPLENIVSALRQAVPDARRIGVFLGPNASDGDRKHIRAAAAANGLGLVEAPVTNLGDLATTARDLVTKVDVLWMPADPVLASPEAFRFLLELSLRTRKPLFVFSDALVRAGAYAGLSPDFGRAGELAGQAVLRIRAGERAGDIPVARARLAHLVVNEGTAKAMGRKVPDPVRAMAEILP